MKKIARAAMTLIIISSLLVVAPVNKANAQFSASISIQTFYNDLAPYGQWIDDPQYGYVWIPDVGPGFRPYYTNGYWVETSYGFMWVSQYHWGWAPFHYGRWVYSSYYDDWVWIPDTDWGPAWVSWRWGNDYCGWAPLGPGISVSFSFVAGYNVPYDWWVFVPARYCLSPSFYNYRIGAESNTTYIRNTTIINNTYTNRGVVYAAGPRINDVQRVTGNRVAIHKIADERTPGRTSVQNNTVRSFRPQVTKNNGGNARPSPRSVITRNQYTEKKSQRNQKVQNVDRGRNQRTDQPMRQMEQKNSNKQVMPERKPPVNNRPPKQMEQKNNNRQVIPERKPPINNQPPKQTEQKNNNRQAIPQRNQPVNNQPPRQTERKQQNMPQHQQPAKQESQPQQRPVPQPQQKQSKPAPEQKKKGHG